MTLGERVKAVRKAAKQTQKEFSSHIGVSGNYIYLIESDKEKPSDRTLNDICRIYGVNKEWIEFETGEPYAEKTAEEQIAELFGEVTNMDQDSMIRQFIQTLAQMSPEQRTMFEEVGKMFFKK